MKISTELERMSDMSENISERVIELNEEPQLKPYIDIPRMANWTMMMVRESLRCVCPFGRGIGKEGMCRR